MFAIHFIYHQLSRPCDTDRLPGSDGSTLESGSLDHQLTRVRKFNKALGALRARTLRRL